MVVGHCFCSVSTLAPMGFTTPTYDLEDLFSRIDRGDIQLPDFQRTFLWNVDQIRSVIVSVLRGYPIGALTALDARNEEIRLKPRPLTNIPTTVEQPGMLLLDGQQRLSTLYLSFQGDGVVKTVDFRQKRVVRKFYVDIAKAVESPIMPGEAVFAVDHAGVVKSHFAPSIPNGLRTREDAVKAHVIPVSALLSHEATDFLFDSLVDADDVWREKIKRFYDLIINPLAGYRVPIIRLGRETEMRAIGSIFSKVNTPGQHMAVIDLLSSVFAAEDPSFQLHQDWERVRTELHRHPVLRGIHSTQFLTALSLLVNSRRKMASGHRSDILRLTLDDYRNAVQETVDAFEKAATFLTQRCMFQADQVPYTKQIIPLAVIIARASEHGNPLAEQSKVDLLNRWWWSGVFGELYGSPAVTTRMAYDVEQVTAWLAAEGTSVSESEQSASAEASEAHGAEGQEGSDTAHGDVEARDSVSTSSRDDAPVASGRAVEPKTVRDAVFHESRLLSVDASSGVYKGILALLMGRGALDWRSSEPFTAETVRSLKPDFNRIFPKEWCLSHGIDPVLWRSILNRTPMGARTHDIIGDYSPQRYLARVQAKSLLDNEEFDQVLASHCLNPQLLHEGNAVEFFNDRRARFLRMIEHAIGKAADHDVNDADLSAGYEGPGAFGK